MRWLWFLIITMLTAGCASTRSQVAGGAAFTVAGSALLLARGNDCSAMNTFDDQLACGFEEQGQEMLGIVLVTAGVAALVMAARKAAADDRAARAAEGKR